MDFTCSLCPRKCRAVRTDSAGEGVCRMPALPRLARAALHFGEEPCLSGTRGSGAVFFSGCALHCRFCQNYGISQDDFGETVSAERLAEIMAELVEQGAHNINFVNPTAFVPAILEAVKRYRPPVPLVYNSSGYERPETLRALEGVIDIYLPDLKYSSNSLAGELSGAFDYTAYALPAIQEMIRQTGPMVLDDDGIARRGTIVRHLVIPGHTADSMEVLRWIQDNLPKDTYVSVLMQYTPIGCLPPPLNRPLTRREYRKIRDYAGEIGLENGYIQQYGSDGTEKIPAFDLTGVHKTVKQNVH